MAKKNKLEPAPKAPKKKANWWKRCCLFFLAFIVLIILGALSLVNAAGLVKTPGLYQAFYRNPEPRRAVPYDPAKPFRLEDILGQVNEGKIPPARLSVNKSGEQAVRITEQEFTAALYEFETGEAGNKKKLKETVRKIQITFEPGSAEIFVALRARPTAILAEFNPIFLPGGGIELDIKSARVGALPVPQPLIGFIEGMIKDTLKDLKTSETKKVELESKSILFYPDFEAIKLKQGQDMPAR